MREASAVVVLTDSKGAPIQLLVALVVLAGKETNTTKVVLVALVVPVQEATRISNEGTDACTQTA